MDFKSMTKVKENFTLRDSISLEELHNLMNQGGIQFPGIFKLKKGLFGPYICFDTFMQIQPIIKVKNNIVKISKVNISKQVGIGGMSIDINDAQQRIQAAKTGGLGKAVMGGQEYFLNVIEKMRELLQSRM